MVASIASVRLVSDSDAALADRVQVRSLQGSEQLGRLYDLTVDFVSSGAPLSAERLLEQSLALELLSGNGQVVRRIHGIASRVTDLLTTEHRALQYRMVFVPRLWRLTLTRTTEIFMDQRVPEVIAAQLERFGMVAGTDYELRLRDRYPTREYIVQYQESDYDFVCRLAEHVGITLFIEQGDDRERVVLTDHSDGFTPLAGDGTARFHPRGDEIGVYELSSTTKQLPAEYVVKDYNYRTPQVALLAKRSIADGQAGMSYEYGGHFKTPDEAARLARVRAEEITCRRTVFEGRSDDLRFGAGTRVKLEGHPQGKPELLLTEVRHDFRQTVHTHGARGDEHGYRNTFTAAIAERPFRPRRLTPKPRIYGHITAQIEAASDGAYAQLDEDGRYRVRFMFDIAARDRAKATRLVRMAQPHAGPGYGLHFPLRHGVEVLITFIDGDPDRPIISGAVPNPQTPSVVGSKNGTRNIIRTGAGNEINIDDTEGQERIKISTPYGGSSFQLGAPNTPSAGAALNTTDAYNAVVGAGVTTASTTVTTFSDIASLFATANIVAFAGGPNILEALMKKGPAIVKGAAKVVDGVLDTAEALDKKEEAKAHEAAAEHREAERRARERAKRVGEYSSSAAQQAETNAANHARAAEYYETQAKAVAAANKKSSDSRA